MRVTIIGAGNMGRGIGTRVVVGGHQAEIVDRDPAEAQQLAEDLGGSATALDPGAPFGGEVVVFAVYYSGIKDLAPATARSELRQRGQATPVSSGLTRRPAGTPAPSCGRGRPPAGRLETIVKEILTGQPL